MWGTSGHLFKVNETHEQSGGRPERAEKRGPKMPPKVIVGIKCDFWNEKILHWLKY